MNHALRALSLVAILNGFTAPCQAQVTVLLENFDSLPLGAYGTPFTYDTLPAPATTIVAPGSGGVGQAFSMNRDFSSGAPAFLWCGVDTPLMSLAGNTETNLAAYTLSFDLATTGETPDYAIGVVLYAAGSAFGSGFGIQAFPTAPTPGSGFQTYSFDMSTLTAPYNSALLDPSVSQLYVELWMLDFNQSVVTGPDQGIILDNLQITLNPIPEPSTSALLTGAVGLLVGWRWYRRES